MSLKFRAFRLVVFAALAAAATLGLASSVFAQIQVPANTGYVNDYAGVFDAVSKQTLENRLRALHDSTDAKIEIAVLTIRSTEDVPIFDYSLAVARGWKIGSKESDNPGLLLLVAIDDRKAFVQVSRDAEGDIPDGLVVKIQRDNLVPAFKAGQYSKGINDTVEAYIRRFGEIRGFDPATLQKTEAKQPAAPVSGRTGRSQSSLGICAVCGCGIAIIIFIFFVSGLSKGTRGGKRSSWSGGGFGGAGGRGGSGLADAALPLLIGSILGSLGSGGSSGSSSSSDWGGSSGGGDWGGFGGGGDFGGGGGGSDW